MRHRNSKARLSLLLGLAAAPAWGQDTRGQILGRVSDPSGAVVAGVQVHCVNVATNVRTDAATNESGDYVLPFLIPGTYTVSAAMQGFKSFAREGIEVSVNDRITLNIALEIGERAELVRVVAEAPLLDTSTASMGQVVGARAILDLPLKDGTVSVMATLVPGVYTMSELSGYTRPFDTNSPSLLSIDGTRTNSNQFSMDGAPNTQRNQVAYSPPPGVVEEFRIQTATFDASYGFMAGAELNMSLKAGTNAVHGQMYHFLQNPKLNANKFFSNRARIPKSIYRMNRWGANASGPVYLPKIYDGRNKSFWMYGYEGIDSYDPLNTVLTAVPTARQRSGDFSELLALGSQYQIYDPYSIQPAPGGRFSRQPLAGNVIPASRIHATARRIVDLFDAPNVAGTVDGRNNYTNQGNAHDRYFNHIFRLDHNRSLKHRTFLRANFTRMLRPQNIRHNRASGDDFKRWNRGLAFDNVYMFSPQFFLNARYSYTRYIEGTVPHQIDWDLASLGFSADYISRVKQVEPRALRLPNIAVANYDALSPASLNFRHEDIHDLAGNFSNIVHSHTMRFGVGYRVYRENAFNLTQSSGSFNFATDWTRGPLDTSPSAPMGQSLASFLYGLPTSGYFPLRDSAAEQARVWALYFQDDWKLSGKLTISFGLRWELPGPLTERYNRSVRGFDANAPLSIEAAARAAYAQNPIPEVPASQFRVRGGLTFAGANGLPRNLWQADNNNLMPRAGFAYSLTPKTVLRGGYGIFFEPLGVVNLHVNQTGFNQNTDFIASLDNGLTYIANLSNPFPGPFLAPAGAGLGANTSLGQGISYFEERLVNPYMQRWQLAWQRELPGRSVIEVSYVGNRGTKQRISRQFNATPEQYLSTSPLRDQRTIDYLAAAVANPFYPLLPGTGLAARTVQRNQLLLPYPQFTGASADVGQGYSWYHSMQVRLEKRLAQNFTSTVAWTWSKLMQALTYLNASDPVPERVISDMDRTQRIVVTGLWELPFGRGKRWGGAANAVVSRMISGWQAQGIYQGQTGQPLGFGNAIFFGNLADIPVPKGQRTAERWFNVDAGFERSAARQLARNLQKFSSRFSGVRTDGINNWDLSVIKNTGIRESVQLQFRAEFINAFNHPQFGSVDTNPASSAFGAVTREWAWPRVIQFGLKLLF